MKVGDKSVLNHNECEVGHWNLDFFRVLILATDTALFSLIIF